MRPWLALILAAFLAGFVGYLVLRHSLEVHHYRVCAWDGCWAPQAPPEPDPASTRQT